MRRPLSITALNAIAAAAAARTREERAVAQYLELGRRPQWTAPRPLAPLLLAPAAADIEAFDGDGERHLRQLLGSLARDERRWLLALVIYARSPSLGFERALRWTYRIPPEAQLGYLMTRRLERDILLGLDRLKLSNDAAEG